MIKLFRLIHVHHVTAIFDYLLFSIRKIFQDFGMVGEAVLFPY